MKAGLLNCKDMGGERIMERGGEMPDGCDFGIGFIAEAFFNVLGKLGGPASLACDAINPQKEQNLRQKRYAGTY